MIVPIPWVIGGIGVASVAVSLPLALGWVPMNRWYGIRTRKAFVSEENWYALNVYGGKVFCVFGLFLVALAWFGRGFAPDPRSLLAPMFMLVPLAALVPALLAIRLYSRRLTDGETQR